MQITGTYPGADIFRLLGSFLDWPIRKFSGGKFCSEVKDVPAAPMAYNLDLAAGLWKQSAVAAGLGSK
jgi:hypothetical protein